MFSYNASVRPFEAEDVQNLDEMAKEADYFAEARGGVHTCINKGQHNNRVQRRFIVNRL